MGDFKIVKRFQQVLDRINKAESIQDLEVIKSWYIQDVSFLADQLNDLQEDYNSLEDSQQSKSWFSKFKKSGNKIKRN